LNNHDKMYCHGSENLRGTCASVEMLKGYMHICWNVEGVHGKKKVWNPCTRVSVNFAK